MDSQDETIDIPYKEFTRSPNIETKVKNCNSLISQEISKNTFKNESPSSKTNYSISTLESKLDIPSVNLKLNKEDKHYWEVCREYSEDDIRLCRTCHDWSEVENTLKFLKNIGYDIQKIHILECNN